MKTKSSKKNYGKIENDTVSFRKWKQTSPINRCTTSAVKFVSFLRCLLWVMRDGFFFSAFWSCTRGYFARSLFELRVRSVWQENKATSLSNLYRGLGKSDFSNSTTLKRSRNNLLWWTCELTVATFYRCAKLVWRIQFSPGSHFQSFGSSLYRFVTTF